MDEVAIPLSAKYLVGVLLFSSLEIPHCPWDQHRPTEKKC